jgi:hypothetical protein
MIIDSTNKRGDSGKGITFWMEPINSSSCDGGTYWCSDGQLAAKLPGSYDELYIRFYIKFQPGWKWADNYSGQMKFFRVGHYWGEGSQFSFGTQGNVAPLVFLDFHDTTGDGYPVFNTIVMPRFQATYRSGTGGCITSPSPSYLVNGDFERLAAPGGTGLNGNKKFGEWFGDNQWHKIEFHVKGNSGIGVADGIYNLTIDDTIILNRTNVAWADAGSCNTGHGIQPPQPFAGWNWFSIGGNMYNRAYSPTEKIEQWYAIDDLVISTTPIGEDDTGTVPGHPSRVWIE